MEETQGNPDPNANALGEGKPEPIANAIGEGGYEHCKRGSASAGERGVGRRIKRNARQAGRELRRKEQKEKKLAAEKKKKEEEERLKKKGRKMTRGQPKITIWLSREKVRTT